jgi:hypothetical protein
LTDRMYILRIIKASYKFQKVICSFNQRSQIFLTQRNLSSMPITVKELIKI